MGRESGLLLGLGGGGLGGGLCFCDPGLDGRLRGGDGGGRGARAGAGSTWVFGWRCLRVEKKSKGESFFPLFRKLFFSIDRLKLLQIRGAFFFCFRFLLTAFIQVLNAAAGEERVIMTQAREGTARKRLARGRGEGDALLPDGRPLRPHVRSTTRDWSSSSPSSGKPTPFLSPPRLL